MGNHILEIDLSPKEIVAREPRLLTDTSNIFKQQNFTDNIYKARIYKELKFAQLREARDSLNDALEFLDRPNIMVIEDTVDELANFSKVISEKARNLNTFEANVPKRVKYGRELGKPNVNKDIFNEICLLSYNLVKKAKEKIYCPLNKERYELLTESIQLITDRIGLKKARASSGEHDKKPLRREYKDLHTDEKFVAALFNSSLEQSFAGISRDGDIRRIFNICYGLIASESLAPYNDPLVKSLQKNPITLYAYSFELTRWESIRTDKLRTEPEFIIRNIPERDSIEVRARVAGALKRAFPLEILVQVKKEKEE